MSASYVAALAKTSERADLDSSKVVAESRASRGHMDFLSRMAYDGAAKRKDRIVTEIRAQSERSQARLDHELLKQLRVPSTKSKAEGPRVTVVNQKASSDQKADEWMPLEYCF